jgi:hypothetical protein
MEPSVDNQAYEEARKRVGFKTHLLVYCVVIGALWLIWAVTWRAFIWPIWPTIGWGIGLTFHYLFVYNSSKFLSVDEEYKKIKKRSEKYTQASH